MSPSFILLVLRFKRIASDPAEPRVDSTGFFGQLRGNEPTVLVIEHLVCFELW